MCDRWLYLFDPDRQTYDCDMRPFDGLKFLVFHVFYRFPCCLFLYVPPLKRLKVFGTSFVERVYRRWNNTADQLAETMTFDVGGFEQCTAGRPIGEPYN